MKINHEHYTADELLTYAKYGTELTPEERSMLRCAATRITTLESALAEAERDAQRWRELIRSVSNADELTTSVDAAIARSTKNDDAS